ncbi:Gfo/Idh/MocA family protein [Rathayibacter soli]|uniref:Gfo/Idh/MocA family protein n=1 Tax=Rathayibacter soli TaxID=3144168 RepID=UPI0027E5B7DC|nr:Gfo/Idh/MocA family oxidoreductase [Glaciibacter superstes]
MNSTALRSKDSEEESGVRWGIVGPGSIAHRFADQLSHSRTGRLTAVASRSLDRARAFAGEYTDPAGVRDAAAPRDAPAPRDAAATAATGIRSYGSYAELFADPEVDAVYIATVHTEHVQGAIDAARAGKHIVCEKPLAVNQAGVFAIVDAARTAGVYLAEGYMYRFHPQTAKLVELVRDRAIGELQHVEASFTYAAELPAEHRLMNPALAGGGILDVGGYPVSAARLLAGAAVGELFADPVSFTGRGTVGATGVDEWASASLEFRSGISAHVTCGTTIDIGSGIVLYGSAGRITVADPWLPSVTDGSRIEIARAGAAVTSIRIPGAYQYALQADALAENLAAGQSPQIMWADSIGNARVLDQWRRAIGMRYPFE